MTLLINRIERHDLVNAVALAGALLIMGFLILGAKSALGSVWDSGLWQGDKIGGEFTAADFDESSGLRQPSEVSVGVANASGIDGQAGRATAILTNGGYGSIEPQNKTGEPLNESVVYWVETDYKLDAIRVASILGIDDSDVRPLPESSGIIVEGADILVLLGLNTNSEDEA